jgi:uncharacterized membrane protein HdeD (DUF308 family)
VNLQLSNVKPATLEKWTWVLIFGGLLVLSVSWFVDDSAVVWAASLAIVGALATIVGVLLIYLRSRMEPVKR